MRAALHDETKIPVRHNRNAVTAQKFLTCLPPQTWLGEKKTRIEIHKSKKKQAEKAHS